MNILLQVGSTSFNTDYCFLFQILVTWICLSLSWAQAPGDEADRCTTDHENPPQYPDTIRMLMDSFSYENLLPGNGTGASPIADAVWNDFSFDGNDRIDTLNPTYVSVCV